MDDRPEEDTHPDNGHPVPPSDVYEALKSAGWAVPQSEDAVRRADEALAGGTVVLPESLRDPQAVLERGPRGEAVEPRALAFPSAGEAAEDLARAAREGGEVPPEIEEIMGRDRRAAEEAFDRDEHGEDVG